MSEYMEKFSVSRLIGAPPGGAPSPLDCPPPIEERPRPQRRLHPDDGVQVPRLRLVGHDTSRFENRAHFFAAAAEAMRRILIDRVRQKRAVRHGGGQQRVDLDLVELPFQGDDDQLLAVNEALEDDHHDDGGKHEGICESRH